MGVKKQHGRTDAAREQTQHERADVAQESRHGTREQMRHKRADMAQRDNKAGVSKGKTIKKNLHELWTNGCSSQGIDAARRGQEGG